MDFILIVFGVVFALLSAGDLFYTMKALPFIEKGWAREVNPVFAWVLGRWGKKGLVGTKFLSMFVVAALALSVPYGWVLFALGGVVGAFAVWNNYNLIRHMPH